MVDPFPPSAAADELLEQLLNSLLGDFRFWFERGEKLLALCPDLVMSPEQRQLLDQELSMARRELLAATSLRQAIPGPMALELTTMAPWHRLVLKIWNLSAALRRAGVSLPDTDEPLASAGAMPMPKPLADS